MRLLHLEQVRRYCIIIKPPPGWGIRELSGATPPNVNPPIFYEPFPAASGNELVLWIIVSAPQPNFGGAQVWASVDGTTYGQLGAVGSGNVQGVLISPFPSHADPDTVDTLAVDVTESSGTITPGSTTDADLGLTMALVSGTELVGYSASTLTSPGMYSLDTYLRRGLFGSPIGGHSTNDSFGLINGSLFKYEYPANLVGRTIFFKFPSFNAVGGGLQALATATVYTYTLTGVGASPSSGSGACPVITVLAGGACCVELGWLGECVSAVCDLGIVGTPVTQCIDLGLAGQ